MHAHLLTTFLYPESGGTKLTSSITLDTYNHLDNIANVRREVEKCEAI